MAIHRLRKIDRRLRPALAVFVALLLVALLRDVLANGRPLYCRVAGTSYYPGLRTIFVAPAASYNQPLVDSLELYHRWRSYGSYEGVVFAPVPFSPGETDPDPQNRLKARPPGAPAYDGSGCRHWLGTDKTGRDVLAGLIAGARIALLTGLLAMSLSFCIGVFFGALAGFWGDDRLRVRRGRLWTTLVGLPVAWFYAFIAGASRASDGMAWIQSGLVFMAIILIFNLLGRLLSRLPGLSAAVVIPADLLVMRSAEVFNALPKFIFLLLVVRLLAGQASLWLLIALIGMLSWPEIAIFVRADLLRIRALDFVTAARSLGLPEIRILLRHALPNALRAAYTAAAIGVASAILLEAALSFLGLSDPSLQGASWGTLLHSARDARSAWWLTLPPGLAICITVLALNKVGEVLSEK